MILPIKNSIDIIDKPTPEEFYENYLCKAKPVLITGIASEWNSTSVWSPDYFKSHFSSTPVRYERGKSDAIVKDPVRFFVEDQTFIDSTLGHYIESICNASGPGRANYLADFTVFDVLPELEEDVGRLDAYMGIPSIFPNSLKQYLQLKPRFWLGPKDSLSSLHFDMAHNFFVQIYGRKQWSIIPPEQSKNLYFPCGELSSQLLHWSPVDIEEPDFNRFPLFKNVKPIQLIVEPGQILFIPASWWHHVRSLETSISLNFFWFSPFSNMKLLKKYLFYRIRRKILTTLGLKTLIPILESN